MSRSKIYRFRGHGSVWDKDKGSMLCRFNRYGYFETTDVELYNKLKSLGYVCEQDSPEDKLSEKDLHIEILKAQIEEKDELIKSLQNKLEDIKSGKEEKPDRKVIIEQLTALKIPFKGNMKTETLMGLLKDYKEAKVID